MIVDCDGCELRGDACHDCVIAVLIGVPPEVPPRPGLTEPQVAVSVAVDALAEAAALPRLRLVPVKGRIHVEAERSGDDAERERLRVG
ncbi:hypothetical protein [Allokutzneria oryzae]|uniref:Uncharacterized protein n=1 Tax=Allokutzneria oryzae TaxID=1378989 RepID=A0ABV5ZNJ6_9PSEU